MIGLVATFQDVCYYLGYKVKRYRHDIFVEYIAYKRKWFIDVEIGSLWVDLRNDCKKRYSLTASQGYLSEVIDIARRIKDETEIELHIT